MEPKYANALLIASRQHVRGMTDKQTADFIIGAQDSGFFYRVSFWCNYPPRQIHSGDRPSFVEGMKFIKQILERGYVEDRGWWWMGDVPNLGGHLALLIDITLTLRALRQDLEVNDTRDFEIFTDIVCGDGWEKAFNEMKRQTRKDQAAKARQGASDVGISRKTDSD
jgi:hypothetical protein